MSFFTYPLEAFAETFLSEGALTFPTVSQAVEGTAAVGTIIGAAALPSVIKSMGRTRSGKRFRSDSMETTLASFGVHSPINQVPRRSFQAYNMPSVHSTQDAPRPPPITRATRQSGPQEGASTTYTQHGNEVSVIPPPKRIALTAPDYFTVNLPYSTIQFYTAAGVDTGNDIRTIRLNSIFDPDSSSGASKQPMGRDTWSNVYQFYRVLATKVVFTVQNQQSKDESSGPKNMVLVGLEHTDDTTATGLSQSREAFMEGKNSSTKLLPGKDNTPANHTVLEFDYTPETWDAHVMETGIEERWTPVGNNPSFLHDLAFRAFQIVAGDTSAYNLIYRMDITYTVQFRELQFSVYKTTH